MKKERENKIKIAMAASEAVPFIKTGGLADVVGSLPLEIDKEDFIVKVFIPKYLCIKNTALKNAEFIKSFYLDCPRGREYVGIFQIEESSVSYYLIDNEFYFNGDRPYGDMKWDIEKFCFFQLAVLRALKELDFSPDIIHCHDWQASLIPVYLKSFYKDDPFYKNTKTVFTIHNLRFQGVYDIDTLSALSGLSKDMFVPDKLEAWGNGNMLKGALLYADRITTVSQSYSGEIKTPEYGEGLDGVMCLKSDKLSGIVNGIDYQLFDPNTDPFIKKNYNVSSFRQKKSANKLELQKRFSLKQGKDMFLMGMVSRLTDQKGLDLLGPVLDEILENDTEIIVLGTGDKRYEDMFRYFAEKYPDKVSANLYYSETLANEIYAGADAYLMPSQFEPCGLSQLIALRYGTVPIVRETGGLKDTVEAYNEYENLGTGFSFRNFTSEDMLKIINYAESVFHRHKRSWNNIVERAMKMDFSWKKSAGEYEKLYKEL